MTLLFHDSRSSDGIRRVQVEVDSDSDGVRSLRKKRFAVQDRYALTTEARMGLSTMYYSVCCTLCGTYRRVQEGRYCVHDGVSKKMA
mmetsp:Transcript_13819/g.26024  ORF Transcript_13819/g.26024 Transcript_13819/m.26024 type:complete len:87 (-) Transcript_13819:2220-2480(-)